MGRARRRRWRTWWDLQRDCRGRAGAALEGEASGIYSRLQAVAAQAVARTASLPALPARVWAAGDQAATVAIQAGHELEWARLVGEATRFDKVHRAAEFLRQSGGLPVMIFPGGCPDALGHLYLNWRAAVEGIPQLKRHVGPLRLRYSVDQGWEPGLWLPADHEARQRPRPGPSLAHRVKGFLIPSPLVSDGKAVEVG